MPLRRVGLVPVCAAAGALVVSKVWLRVAPGSAVRWAMRSGDQVGPGVRKVGASEVRPPDAPNLRAPGTISPLAGAVAGVGARWPFRATCLEQGIALVILLKVSGVPARVTIGVARSGVALNGHAYVESSGRVILGAAHMEGLLPLPGLSCRG